MQPNGEDPLGSPVEYPTVTVDGQKYAVKFSNRTLYRLDKDGVDLAQFASKLKSGSVGVSMIYDLLAAAIQVPKHVPRFSAEDLADVVPTAEATRAVLDAMGKAQPPAEMKLTEPAANPLQ